MQINSPQYNEVSTEKLHELLRKQIYAVEVRLDGHWEQSGNVNRLRLARHMLKELERREKSQTLFGTV